MTDTSSGRLGTLAAALGKAKGPAPVEQWNPPFCGEIDIRVAADGRWFYQGSPIGRRALVRLFASVLKREGERHYLVTPAEKLGIAVDDAPFLAVEMEEQGAGGDRALIFRTNVDDFVRCDAEHGLRFEPEPDTGGTKPYLHVRRGLWALVSRPVYLDLVALGEVREIEGRKMFGVASAGSFFAMAPAGALDGS